MPRNKKKRFLFLLGMLICIILVSIGCSVASETTLSSITHITNPAELPEDLAKLKIFFTKYQNEETYVHITSIDMTDAKTIKLIHGGRRVALSPNGCYLAFSRLDMVEEEQRSGIWVHDLQDGTERKVIGWPESFNDVHIDDPSFSPDSESLVFDVTWLDDETTDLATINLDGSNLQVIDVEKPLNNFPKYSPDGEKIIVICSGIGEDPVPMGFQLCVMSSDGTKRELLTRTGDSHGAVVFLSNSQQFIYTESESRGIIKKHRDSLCIMDIDGENVSCILDWRIAKALAISDDGDEVIFDGSPEQGVTHELYIINIDGTNLRHLQYFDEFLEQWYQDEE